jgi:hypothetical protein
MTAPTAADDTPVVAPHSVINVVAGLVRTAVAPGQGWSYETLADATGLKVRRLKSYVHESKEPSLSAALSICLALGPKAVNALLAVIGYAARPLDEADTLQPMQIAAGAMAQLSIIANAAADGRIDHQEAPICRDAADLIIATVLPLSSAGQAG